MLMTCVAWLCYYGACLVRPKLQYSLAAQGGVHALGRGVNFWMATPMRADLRRFAHDGVSFRTAPAVP
jgi:hypothetical protein